MKNILFIAYEYPPLRIGGVFRPLAFTKYLKEYNINPIVITLNPESYPIVFDEYITDDDLGKDVISNTRIIHISSTPIASKTKKNKIKNFIDIFFTVHGQEGKGWKKSVFQNMDAIIQEYSPVSMMVTVPPFSIMPLFIKISKLYNIPLLLDFRDAWSQWRVAPYATKFHYLLTLFYEKKYLKNADFIIATSEQTIKDFNQLHPTVSHKKFHYIPNGYDGELKQWQPISPLQKTYTIGYVGSFYYSSESRKLMLTPWWKKKGHRKLQYTPDVQDWLYRTPFFFFKAVKLLFDTYPEWKNKINIEFVGKTPVWLKELINEYSLQNNVTLKGEMSHQKALEFQQSVDALLLTSSKRMGKPDYSIAGKTFEYFQMQKPIIGFVCEGSQKDILLKSNMALICNPDDSFESAKQLLELFSGQIELKPDMTFLKTLHRRQLTKKMADIINSI